MSTIIVEVVNQKFYKPEDGFRICEVRLARVQPVGVDIADLPVNSHETTFGFLGEYGGDDRFVASGHLFEAQGTWGKGRYGPQFRAKVVTPVVQATERSVFLFLHRFDGIGPKRARDILDHFGGPEEVLDALVAEDAYTRLLAAPGIGEALAEKIVREYAKLEAFRESLLLLNRLGLPPWAVEEALDLWEAETADVIKRDPYELVVIGGLSFNRVDAIARENLGVAVNDPRRMAAGVYYLLQEEERGWPGGHTYTPTRYFEQGVFSKKLAQMGLLESEVPRALEILQQPRRVPGKRGEHLDGTPAIRIDGPRIYLNETYWAERGIPKEVERLRKARPWAPADRGWTTEWSLDGTPDPRQAEVLRLLEANPIVVMTGGPGTGKSYTCAAVVRAAERAGLPITAMAPTGKAAVTLRGYLERAADEVTTIHRRLRMARPDDEPGAQLIPLGLVIIDESSMLDTELAAAVLREIPSGSRVVFVGDVDQLPSVGPGRVLADLINSAAVPVVRLETIFRQAAESGIPYAARELKSGQTPRLRTIRNQDPNTTYHDAWLWETEDEHVGAWVVGAVEALIREGKIDDWRYDLLVLTPQNPGPAGVEALNFNLQDTLNQAEVRAAERGVYIGGKFEAFRNDKVLQTVNNYDLHVMNGEIGVVEEASVKGIPDVGTSSGKPGVLRVRYPHITVWYDSRQARELKLGYAVSVHKSQGSQARAVVTVATRSHRHMLTRALAYTGLTRAQEFVVFVGQREALDAAANNVREEERRTYLRERLQYLEEND